MADDIEGIRIGVVLAKDQNDTLDRLVRKEGRSKSWMIRAAIDQYLRARGISKSGK